MFRKLSLPALAAVHCLMVGLTASAQVDAANIPDYFFQQWTVSSNCAEQHAGAAAQVATGLMFRISKDTASADGSYTLQALDVGQSHWSANWNGLKLEYRAGTQMSAVPADFECIPGAESSSPFLALSGYVQTAEPYYMYAHWYGETTLNGQLEHVLIFPRNVSGEQSAIIVLQSAAAPTDLQLDDNGVINSHN